MIGWMFPAELNLYSKTREPPTVRAIMDSCSTATGGLLPRPYNSRYIPDQDWDKVCSTIVYDNLVGGSDAADSSIRFFRKYHRPQIPNFFKNS